MTLSFSQLGKLGRIGNCLFQAASTIGIARKNDLIPVFPHWDYERYFDTPLIHVSMGTNNVSENGFLYQDVEVKNGDNLVGYFQSEKYWAKSKEEVLKQFKFQKNMTDFFTDRHIVGRLFEKEVIGIHIRRGDYVDNPNYVNLPIEYYTGALKKYFPDWKEKNILIVSDDIDYAKSVFPISDNVHYSVGRSDIDDLCLLSLCSHWIIANSTFSWWGAYLGSNQRGGTVVAPANYFEGPMKETHPLTDFYPEGWNIYDHEAKEVKEKFLEVLPGSTITVTEHVPLEVTTTTITPDPEVPSTFTEPASKEVKKETTVKATKKAAAPKKKK